MAKKKPEFDLPEPEIIAEGVSPDAAIEFWKQRAKLTDDEAKALGEEAKYRAFYVTGLAKNDLVQLVSDGIEEALKNGETLADFKKRIAAAIQAQGWHDYRVENIFRTNLQTAYAAGRYKKGREGITPLLAIYSGHGQAGTSFARHSSRQDLSCGPRVLENQLSAQRIPLPLRGKNTFRAAGQKDGFARGNGDAQG